MPYRHSVRAIVLVALVALMLQPRAAGAQQRPVLRVRSAERSMIDVLQEGCDRSPTFRALVGELEGSDVIVYVEPASDLPSDVDAHMRFAGATPAARYVRIAVSPKIRGDRLIALIGHELQHAREVANAAAVRDAATLAAMYRRIGDQNARGWDTEAACAIGARVRDELQRNAVRANTQ